MTKGYETSDGVEGKLTVQLMSQYAVDFFFIHSQLNDEKMKESMMDWVSTCLNHFANIKDISGQTERNSFVINTDIEIPNTSTEIGGGVYLSLHTLFPQLFPSELPSIDSTSIFYFPYYDKVDLKLNLKAADAGTDSAAPYSREIDYRYEINPGPVSNDDMGKFILDLHTISDAFNKTIKLKSGS